jgi:hypothetical protein
MEQNGPLGIDPNGKKNRQHVPPRSSKFFWILGQSQSVPSDNREYVLVLRVFVLNFDPVGEGAQIVA